MPCKILITGGNGFIAKNLYEQLKGKYEIYGDYKISTNEFWALAYGFGEKDAFLRGEFSAIDINDQLRGNSYQDLLLTRVGVRFAKRIEEGMFETNEEAAAWLKMMLTDDISPSAGVQRLEEVPEYSEYYDDARWMIRMIESFKKTQSSTN